MSAHHTEYAGCTLTTVHPLQVYEHLVFKGSKHVSLRSLPGMRERCIRIGSAGKTFSLTAWKVWSHSQLSHILSGVSPRAPSNPLHSFRELAFQESLCTKADSSQLCPAHANQLGETARLPVTGKPGHIYAGGVGHWAACPYEGGCQRASVHHLHSRLQPTACRCLWP